MITFCQGYGSNYNPSKVAITIPSLQTLHTNSEAKINGVTTQNTAFNNAVNSRILAFKDIRPLSTRLLNALQTTDASAEMINNAKTINRKIQGKRATPVASTTTPIDTNTQHLQR